MLKYNCIIENRLCFFEFENLTINKLTEDNIKQIKYLKSRTIYSGSINQEYESEFINGWFNLQTISSLDYFKNNIFAYIQKLRLHENR